MIVRYICLCIFAMLLCCCKDGNERKKTFPSTSSLQGKLIPIDEIIKIGAIYKLDEFIILRNDDTNSEYFFYAYSYPDVQFLYSFCRRGEGPEEFLMPTVIKNTPHNLFSIRDHATDKYANYQLTDTAATIRSTYTVKPIDNRFFWEINYVDDSRYLLKRSNSKWRTRELWNLAEQKILDTIPNTFNLPKEMGKSYYTEFDDCWITCSNKKMAFAYFFIDRIEIGIIQNDQLKMNSFTGVTKPPKFHLFKDSNGKGKYEFNVDNNIVHYECLSSTPKYIYALYAGIPWGDLENEHSSIIETYDWNGQPQRKLNLNLSISSFVVDENKNVIYGINPNTTEDAIVMFQLDDRIPCIVSNATCYTISDEFGTDEIPGYKR